MATINAGDSYLVDKPHLPEIIGDETVIMHEFSQQVKKVLDSMKNGGAARPPASSRSTFA